MGRWLGDELRRIRQAGGLSLRDVAGAIGMHFTGHVAYERGTAVPPPERRRKLASALGITREELDELVEDDEYEVFLRARSLSEEGRAAARDFLRSIRQRDRERRQRKGP